LDLKELRAPEEGAYRVISRERRAPLNESNVQAKCVLSFKLAIGIAQKVARKLSNGSEIIGFVYDYNGEIRYSCDKDGNEQFFGPYNIGETTLPESVEDPFLLGDEEEEPEDEEHQREEEEEEDEEPEEEEEEDTSLTEEEDEEEG